MSKVEDYGKIGEILVNKISEVYSHYSDPCGVRDFFIEVFKDSFREVAEDLSSEQRLLLATEIIEKRKFRNLSDIIQKALNYIHEDAQPQNVDEDWIMDFFDKASKIRTEQFQNLWAQILAEEINSPKSISRRLLHNLYLFGKQDAENFLNFSRFCFYDRYEDIVHPLIFIREHPNAYANLGITTHLLNELEKFSLIELSYDVGYVFYEKKHFLYTNHFICVTGSHIPAGNVKMTLDGQTLFKIIEKQNNENILSYTVRCWEENGCEVKVDYK